jgi:glycosyltransferase involved in cell wall biosynthesis
MTRPIDPAVAEALRSGGGRVFLNTVRGGGAYRYLERVARRMPILVIDLLDGGPVTVEWIHEGGKTTYSAPSMEAAVRLSGASEVHVNHLVFARPLAGWPERLRRLSATCRLHMVVHDFFAVCPSVNLLDHRGRYCGIPEPSACDTCLSRLADSAEATEFSRLFAGKYPEVRSAGIGPWRKTWLEILGLMDTVVFPSASTRDLFRKAYPGLDPERCRVVPHEVPDLGWRATPGGSDRYLLEVCLIGEISDHKGARILDALLSRVMEESLPVRFRVIGTFLHAWRHRNNPHLIETGLFHPADLPGLLDGQRIDLFFFPSIWPETFSYVVHEMMGTGLPVLATRIGAHGDALAGYPGAMLVDGFDADAFLERLLDFQRQRLSSHPAVGDGVAVGMQAQKALHAMRVEGWQQRLEAMRQRVEQLERELARAQQQGPGRVGRGLRRVRKALSRRWRAFKGGLRRNKGG